MYLSYTNKVFTYDYYVSIGNIFFVCMYFTIGVAVSLHVLRALPTIYFLETNRILNTNMH